MNEFIQCSAFKLKSTMLIDFHVIPGSGIGSFSASWSAFNTSDPAELYTFSFFLKLTLEILYIKLFVVFPIAINISQNHAKNILTQERHQQVPQPERIEFRQWLLHYKFQPVNCIVYLQCF